MGKTKSKYYFFVGLGAASGLTSRRIEIPSFILFASLFLSVIETTVQAAAWNSLLSTAGFYLGR
jgi:hypothetical protein